MTELRFGSAAKLYSGTIHEPLPNHLDLLDQWFPALIVRETKQDGTFRKEAEYNDREFCIEAVKYNGSFYAGGSRRVAQITGRLIGTAKGNQEKERKTASILQKHLAEVMVTDLSVLTELQKSVLERIEPFNEAQRESFYGAMLEYIEAMLDERENKPEYERLEELFPLDTEVFEGILYNAVYQMVIQTDQSIANGYLWLLLGGLLRNEAGRVLRLYDSSFIPIRRQSSEDGTLRDRLRYLIAPEQYESFYEGDDLDMRYPGIEWYCDRCEAHLNEQEGFTDRHPIWVCTACGYENRIDADVIYNSQEDYHHQVRPMTEEEVRHAVAERAEIKKRK